MADTERSLDETGVFKAAASSVRSQHRGAGRPRQPLIVIYFRWMWWCAIQINVGIGTSYEIRHVENPKINNGDVDIHALMRR